MEGLAHLAIAVADLEQAAELYRALGFAIGDEEIVEREKVRLRKATRAGLCIELLAASSADDGSIAKFLARRGPGLHHVALNADNLVAELRSLEKCGIKTLPGYPASGAKGTVVAFLDPRTTGGVLIELVEGETAQ